VKLHVCTAYAPKEIDGNLGRTYNSIMESTDADYVAFVDHDAMFTTSDWYHQICEIIDQNKDAGLFTAVTNRIYNKQQLRPLEGHDYLKHRSYGKELQSKHRTSVEPMNSTNPKTLLSGVLMVVNRKAWEEVKFREGFLGVDNSMHKDMLSKGWDVLLMTGVYLYHFYRGDNDLSHVNRFRKLTCRP